MAESPTSNNIDIHQREKLKAQQIADLRGKPIEPIKIGSYPPSTIPEFYGYTSEEFMEIFNETEKDLVDLTCPLRIEGYLYTPKRNSLVVPGGQRNIAIESKECKSISSKAIETGELEEIEARHNRRVKVMKTIVKLSPSIGSEQLKGSLVAHFASERARSNMRDLLFVVAESEKWTGDDIRSALLALDTRLMTNISRDEEIDKVRDNWIKYTKLVGKYSLDVLRIVKFIKKDQ